MGNQRYKPLRPTTSQINRVLKELPGEGFFIYNYGNGKTVEVVEFRVNQETGILCNQAGKPLKYEVHGQEMVVISKEIFEALNNEK